MSAGFEVATAIAVSQPRRAVIDRAWRAIGPGVEVLSGDDGGPLRRTVKRIIDPLVLRLRANTQYSAPFVDADTALAMHDVIVGQGAQLRAAAAWFELLKRERRRLRITTGNAQELYFPVCFELAVTKGAPAQQDDRSAEAVLLEIHADRDRTGIEVLNQYVADPQVVAALSDQLGRVGATYGRAGITGPFLAGLTTVLGPADSHSAAAARQRVWSALIADATPYNLGAKAHSAAAELPWSITELGLSSVEPQPPARDRWRARWRSAAEPRVVDRVRATLRRVMDRDELPDIPLLCRKRSIGRAPVGPAGRGQAGHTDRRDRDRASTWHRWPNPRRLATSWPARSRPGCVRRRMCCTRAAISPTAAPCIRGSNR